MVSNQGTYFVTPMDNSMEQTGFPTGKPKQAHHQYHDSTSFDPFHPTEFSADEIYQPVPIYSSSELWDLQEKELVCALSASIPISDPTLSLTDAVS